MVLQCDNSFSLVSVLFYSSNKATLYLGIAEINDVKLVGKYDKLSHDVRARWSMIMDNKLRNGSVTILINMLHYGLQKW